MFAQLWATCTLEQSIETAQTCLLMYTHLKIVSYFLLRKNEVCTEVHFTHEIIVATRVLLYYTGCVYSP